MSKRPKPCDCHRNGTCRCFDPEHKNCGEWNHSPVHSVHCDCGCTCRAKPPEERARSVMERIIIAPDKSTTDLVVAACMPWQREIATEIRAAQKEVIRECERVCSDRRDLSPEMICADAQPLYHMACEHVKEDIRARFPWAFEGESDDT